MVCPESKDTSRGPRCPHVHLIEKPVGGGGGVGIGSRWCNGQLYNATSSVGFEQANPVDMLESVPLFELSLLGFFFPFLRDWRTRLSNFRFPSGAWRCYHGGVLRLELGRVGKTVREAAAGERTGECFPNETHSSSTARNASCFCPVAPCRDTLAGRSSRCERASFTYSLLVLSRLPSPVGRARVCAAVRVSGTQSVTFGLFYKR